MPVRANPSLTVIQIGGQEHVISYADDILIFLSNLAVSIQNLIKQNDKFGQFSGGCS